MTTANLPPQSTSFIGREDEINEIMSLLDDPACRLLTLVGPGGIGKTRLAIEVAAQMLEDFADGVTFVDLQPLSDTAYLVPSTAEEIGVTLYGQDDPRSQLLRALRDKSMLLVMDNFEHLLDGADLLTAILDAAPAVRLLVTSREILNIQAEWLYLVQGLRFPSIESPTDAEPYDAVQLFASRAHQVRRDFSLTDDLHHVTRICQLVEGMPLALELAANWLRAVSCAQVADEVERNLDFLATTMRDLPERHRNMWAVFTPTWHRLTHEEREVFKRLAVFRGGFRREAAEQVAGAPLSMLAALGDRSLLRITPTGRYEIHELVRQYGEERLKENPDEWDQVQDRHCAYYAAFVSRQEAALKGPDQIDALARITDEIDNVRAAWRWAATQWDMTAIGHALDGLALYYEMRGLRWEERAALDMALEHVDEQPSVIRGRLMIWHSHSRWGLASADAEREMEEGIAMLQDYGAEGIISIPLYRLASSNNRARRMAVKQFCLQNLSIFKQTGDTWAMAITIAALGAVYEHNGEYETARDHYEKSLALCQADGNQYGMAVSHAGLEKVAWAQGRYGDVRRHAQQHLTICEAIGDVLGIMFAQVFLGGVAYQTGDYDEAKRLFQHNLTLAAEYSEPPPLMHLVHLAMVAHRQADVPLCRRYLHKAGQIVLNEARAREFSPEFVIGTARLWITEGRKERAVELITAALPDWSAIEQQLRQYPNWSNLDTPPDALLAELESDLPPEVFAAANRRGEASEIDAVVADVVEDLAASIAQLDATKTPVGAGVIPSDQPLIEPLTERERQVLALIIEGYANREIADRLYIGVSTVKKHINHIYGKLGVDTRARAIVRVQELKLTDN